MHFLPFCNSCVGKICFSLGDVLRFLPPSILCPTYYRIEISLALRDNGAPPLLLGRDQRPRVQVPVSPGVCAGGVRGGRAAGVGRGHRGRLRRGRSILRQDAHGRRPESDGALCGERTRRGALESNAKSQLISVEPFGV